MDMTPEEYYSYTTKRRAAACAYDAQHREAILAQAKASRRCLAEQRAGIRPRPMSFAVDLDALDIEDAMVFLRERPAKRLLF
jgi:hypothetical protein